VSGFVCLWNVDGRPVEPRLVRNMTDTIAHRGPDGVGYWTDRSIALGHRNLRTTPQSAYETQPLPDETNTLCLALDGRVDNREELRDSLGRKGLTFRTDTDAELVLRAYECWGQACPEYILGDFAFVIWDGRVRQIFCARDPMGCKPLYYYQDERVFICASAFPPFFAHPAVRQECNEGMVGEYLANAVTSHEETLFQNIRRLPPACTLTVAPQRLRTARFWRADSFLESRRQRNDAYVEQFRHLFREAVRVRLRSNGPVGAELSGGLDSSSVVGMAQRLLREGAAADRGFETFSLIFQGLPCDERPYIHEVVRMWGLTSNMLPPEPMDQAGMVRQIRQHLDFPDYPNHAMSDPLYRLANEKGIRVILTGLGGDDWLGEGFPPYADLLRQGKLRACLRAFRKDSDEPLSIFKGLLATFLPKPVHRAYQAIFHRGRIPSWVDPGFARRVRLADRLGNEPEAPKFSSYAQRDILLAALDGERAHAYDMTERSSSGFGFESRHPFNDRRFVEFALALPNDQRYHGDQVKVVLRHALAGVLPERVRQRHTKAEFSHLLRQACLALSGERLFDRLAGEGQWVNGERVRAMIGDVRRRVGQGHNPPERPARPPLDALADYGH
jgi:asparagine synthase (glutamine-hydrolysing)